MARAFWTAHSRVFSSDHSPWNYADKIAGGPDKPFTDVLNGIPGIETRLPLFFSATQADGRLTLNQFVDITTTTPAKLYGLYPRKGVIAVGSDADFAIWDPDKRVTIRNEMLHHAVDHTPYEGMQVRGWPVMTISRGEVVYADGRGDFDGGPRLLCAVRAPLHAQARAHSRLGALKRSRPHEAARLYDAQVEMGDHAGLGVADRRHGGGADAARSRAAHGKACVHRIPRHPSLSPPAADCRASPHGSSCRRYPI